MNEEHLHVTGKVPDIPKQLTGDDRRRVPLTVYIGGIKRIVGVAVLEGDQVDAYIDPKADLAQALIDLVSSGVLQTVSIAFNAPPATPVINNEGQINWHKNY
jgi:hypothetical protein